MLELFMFMEYFNDSQAYYAQIDKNKWICSLLFHKIDRNPSIIK